MNFYGAFRHAAALWPENPAIFSGREQRAAFVELEERALRLAGGLLSLGLARGDRVGVVMDNRPEYLEVMLATWAAGLCLVPMNAKLHEREFAYVLANSGARVVLRRRVTLACSRASPSG
jgi:long-chain acyl-CoA synthetase